MIEHIGQQFHCSRLAGTLRSGLAAFLLLILLAMLCSAPARSQSAGGESAADSNSNVLPANDPGLSAAEIDGLIATISDPGSRATLIRRLEALKSAAESPEGPEEATGPRPTQIVGLLSERIARLGKELAEGMALVLQLSKLPVWLNDHLARPETREQLIASVWQLLTVFFLSVLGQIVSTRLLLRSRTQIETQTTASRLARLPLLFARTVIDILPTVVFATTAYLVLSVIEPVTSVRLIALSLVNAIVIARVIMSVARMCLAPRVGSLRIPAISDENSNYLNLWIRRLTNIGCYGFFLAESALILGLPESGHLVVTRAIGLLLALLLCIFILQNQQTLDRLIRGDNASAGILRSSIGSSWHVLAIIYVTVVYVAWALGLEGLFILRTSILTAVIFAGAWGLSIGLRHLLNRVLGLRPDILAQFPGLPVRANRYFNILHVVVTGFIWFFGLLCVLEVWGMDAFGWMGSALGSQIIDSLLSSIFVIVAAVIFWEIASSIIERHLNAEVRGSRTLDARTRTLLPLAHKTLLIVVATVAGFTILSEIGIDIGPLIAGAGVIGLAIGFGSQTLVKDIVTGAFILAEDQFNVGDVITVGSRTGTVEQVTIRTIRIRDLAGNVHIIPFSSVSEVENLTSEFSRYIFDIGIGYGEDVDSVIEVLRDLGEEMCADPAWGEHIQEPLEIMGLQEMADSAIIIRALFQTAPGYQWQTGREFNRRIKNRFDELGIEIPFPHRTIHIGESPGSNVPAAPLTAQRQEVATTPPSARTARETMDSDQ